MKNPQLIRSKCLWGPSLLVLLKTWIATSYKFHLSKGTNPKQNGRKPNRKRSISIVPPLWPTGFDDVHSWLEVTSQTRGILFIHSTACLMFFFGSLEWFYRNIPSTLGDASCELGEHLKHSRIFFSLLNDRTWAYLRSVQNPGWVFYKGDEIQPEYMGITISYCKDPY